MKGYQTRTPRVAFGAIAVAMAALTLGATVVLPAKLETVGEERALPASAAAQEWQWNAGDGQKPVPTRAHS